MSNQNKLRGFMSAQADQMSHYSKDQYFKKVDEFFDNHPQGYGFGDLKALNLPKTAPHSELNTSGNKTTANLETTSQDPQGLESNVSRYKEAQLNMTNKNKTNSNWSSDAEEIAAALGLSSEVVAKGMGVKKAMSSSNSARSAQQEQRADTSHEIASKVRSQSKKEAAASFSAVNKGSSHERQFRSIEIMTELGLVVNDNNYETYCSYMKGENLEPYSKDALVAMMVCFFFSKGGILDKELSNYNPRKGQLEFADSVVRAMAKNDVLIVEAGTGTGKTFSYLVPPLMAGKKILVSTKTKALQDQLIVKDIPNLLSMMGLDEHNAISLKGQSNYICRYLLDGDANSVMDKKLWAYYNKESEKSASAIKHDIRNASFGEITFKVPEKFRPYISCDSYRCLEMSHSCPYAIKKREFLKNLTEVVDKAQDDNHDINYVLRHLNDYSVPDIDEDNCFAFAARQEAKRRDITVINHALFFAGLNSESGIGALGSSVPLPDVLIFDEAHTLADVGREFYSSELTSQMIIDFIDKVRNILPSGTKSGDFNKYLEKLGYCAFLLNLGLTLLPEGRYSVSAVKYLHHKIKSPFELLKYRLANGRAKIALMDDSYYMQVVNKGLAENNAKLFEEDGFFGREVDRKLAKSGNLLDDDQLEAQEDSNTNESSTSKDKTQDDDTQLSSLLQAEQDKIEQKQLKRKNSRLDRSITSYVKLEFQRLALDLQKSLGLNSLYNESIDISDEYSDVIKDYNDLPVADAYFRALMADMHKALSCINTLLEKNKEMIGEGYSLVKDLAEDYQNFLIKFMTTDRNKKQEECFENAGWIEIGKEDTPAKLVVCPIDIGDKFFYALQELNSKGVTVVLTSATITYDKDFGKFCYELGLPVEKITTRIVESPFNYAKNACMFLSGNFPSVYDRNFIKDSLTMIDELIKKATGGIFMLCTSFANMKKAKEVLEQRYGNKRTIYMQNDDSVPNLIKQFKEDGKAILIGTSSFWEGVDVAGNALSLVIIDKLPFKQVGDPLQMARKNKVERLEKGNFFIQVQVPEAIITLRQGAGRLIRNETDQGVLVILDQRLITARYGSKCINSLPPMTRVDSVAQALPFFKSNKSKSKRLWD